MKQSANKAMGLILTLVVPVFSVFSRPQTVPAGGAGNTVIRFQENEEIPEKIRLETFTLVWETIRDKYYDPTFGGRDWNALGAKYRPLAAGMKLSGEFHALLGKMLAALGRSHLSLFAPHQRSASGNPAAVPRMAPPGIKLCAGEGRIFIASVAEDSPAWAAGLRAGFVLTKAGDSPFPAEADIHQSAMRALIAAQRGLAGPEGTSVDVTLLDENDREKMVSLARTVPFRDRANLAKSIFEHRRVHPRVGYMRFDGWAFDLKPKLEAALKDLWDSDGLIFDCRQNRGGVNPGVDYLASVLFAEPGLIAVETPRQGERREWKHGGSGAGAYQGGVAVLIDDGSGSASEVFAGWLQETGRAVILGNRSFGGVLSSTQVPLPTDGVLQFPHSDMRTAKGKSIEGAGVVPDIPVEMTRADLLRGKDTVVERAIREILRRSAPQD